MATLTKVDVARLEPRDVLASAALTLGGVFGSLGLLWAALELIRSVFPPSDRVLSGPLYGGALVVLPPLATMVLWVVPLTVAKKIAEMRGAELFAALRARYLSIPFVATALALLAIYLVGLSFYWVVTPEGVTVHRLYTRIDYPWRELVAREVRCRRGKGRERLIELNLDFADGLILSVAETQQANAARSFGQLTMLTQGVRSRNLTRNLADCPSEIMAALSRW